MKARTFLLGLISVALTNPSFVGSAQDPENAPAACTPIPSVAVSWWRAESNALDSADSNNGTLVNGTSFAPGKVGTAFQFNGINTKIELGDSENLKLTNSFSIETWVWIKAGPTVDQLLQLIFFRGDTRFAADPYYLSVQPGGGLRFHIEGNVSGGVNLEIAPVPQQQWLHVAAVFDATVGSMKLYTNAQLAGQLTTATRPFRDLIGGGACIGNHSVGYDTSAFNGLIDELAVYARPLTLPEIQAVYQADSAGKCLTPPTIVAQPLSQVIPQGEDALFSVSVLGSRPLQYQWRFNGANLAGKTNPVLIVEKVQPKDAGYYSVVVSNPVGEVRSADTALKVGPPLSCTSIPSGPVSWWRAESNALDSADSNNGTLVNGTSFAPGKVGTAFQFNGINTKIELGDSENLKLTNSFSIETWVWIKAGPTVDQLLQLIFFRGDTRFAADPYYLSVQPGGGLRFHIEGNVSGGVNLEIAPVPQQQWLHVAAVFDATVGSMKLYTNAQLAGQLTTATRPFRDLIGGGACIGNHSVGYDTSAFNGLIDELAVYARPLTLPEIQAVYQADSAGKCLAPSPAPSPAPPIVAGSQLRCEWIEGQPILRFAGTTGQQYYVQASTDLTEWMVIGPATSLGDGNFEFSDPDWTNYDARFYRIISP